MSTVSRQMSPKMRSFFARVFPLPFVLGGVLALGFGLHGLYRAWESTTWPAAEGRIQSSAVEYELGGTGRGIYHAKGRGMSGTYHARVQYTFTVDGREYSGSRVAFGDYGASDPGHAQAIVDRYPKDKVIAVRHRANAPGDCVLEPGIQAQAWFLPGFGLVFLLAGTLMAVFLPQMMKKRVPFGQPDGASPAAHRGPPPATGTKKYTWKMGLMRYNVVILGFAGFCVLFSLVFIKILGIANWPGTLETVLKYVMCAIAVIGCLGLVQVAVNLAFGISPYFEFEGRTFRNFLPRAFGYKRIEIDLSQQVEFAKTSVRNVVCYRFTDKHGVETTTDFIFGTPMDVVIQKIREANPSITITEVSRQDNADGCID